MRNKGKQVISFPGKVQSVIFELASIYYIHIIFDHLSCTLDILHWVINSDNLDMLHSLQIAFLRITGSYDLYGDVIYNRGRSSILGIGSMVIFSGQLFSIQPPVIKVINSLYSIVIRSPDPFPVKRPLPWCQIRIFYIKIMNRLAVGWLTRAQQTKKVEIYYNSSKDGSQNRGLSAYPPVRLISQNMPTWYGQIHWDSMTRPWQMTLHKLLQ